MFKQWITNHFFYYRKTIENEKSASFPGSTSTIKGIQTVYKQHTNYNNYNIVVDICKYVFYVPFICVLCIICRKKTRKGNALT
jgi:hypothetical protein